MKISWTPTARLTYFKDIAAAAKLQIPLTISYSIRYSFLANRFSNFM